MIYVLHGTDDFSLTEKFDELKKGWGDSEALSINTTVLEGRDVELSSLLNTCNSMPFMGGNRLVVVRGLLSRFERKKGGEVSRLKQWESLADHLAGMPASTHLVFMEGDITKNNPLLKRLTSIASVHWRRLPTGLDLQKWIVSRVTVRGGRISPRAASLLGELAGDNLWVLTNEIEKLCIHANGRPISDADVRALTTYLRETSVFALVDAIVEMRISAAMQLLHRMIDDGASPAYLLSMLARQLRLMVQVRDFTITGISGSGMREALGLSSRFPIDRLVEQSRKYSPSRLMEVYQKLLDTDLAIKTGRWKDDLALDLLVAELSMREKPNT